MSHREEAQETGGHFGEIISLVWPQCIHTECETCNNFTTFNTQYAQQVNGHGQKKASTLLSLLVV